MMINDDKGYKSYKRKIALVYKYLFNYVDNLELEKLQKDDYFKFRSRYKDEVDYLEDMVLEIRLKEAKQLQKAIYNLLNI